MKNFKEFLAESAPVSKFARSVQVSPRATTTAKGALGFLHFAHGSDYDVFAPDAHDLAYFGKNVVRLKGKTTGKTQAAYVDWKKGTVAFYSGNPEDDKDFEKPAKFKAATLYEESEELLNLYDQLAEDFEITPELDESVKLVKGKVYKMPTNDMRLMYTGRTKNKATGEYAVFTVVDSSGKPRLVSGKRFEQEYKGDMTSKLALVEDMTMNEANLTKSSPNVKKIVTALKKKFDVYVEIEDKKKWNEEGGYYEKWKEVRVEYYEKGEDSEPVGSFTTADGEKFKFGQVYSKARSDHNKVFDAAHIVSGVKSGHFDQE